DGGSGFASQNDRRLHFGLGSAGRVDRAVIRCRPGTLRPLGTRPWTACMASPSLVASRALWARLGGLDPRYPVSFLITLILVLGEARYGILGGYDRLATALGVCVATELALSWWLRGGFANV